MKNFNKHCKKAPISVNSVIDWVRIYDNDKYQYQFMICSQAVNLQLVGVRNR